MLPPEQALYSSGPNPHLTDGVQSGTGLVLDHYSKMEGQDNNLSCSSESLLTAHMNFLSVPNPFPHKSLGTLNFSVLFIFTSPLAHMSGTELLNKYLVSERTEMLNVSE